ncbi:MAG: hypothetical protein HOP21_09285 [Methylotenera sp.]|nr:hypothetical protein [Methylotenera sp.]
MLLPWSKPSSILIAPEGLALCHANSATAQMLTHHTTPQRWDALLQNLVELLPELSLKHVRFVISHYFVRQAVLPWQEGVFSQQDWQGLGEHHFRQAFGAVCDDWQVQVALQGYGKPALACAMDHALTMQLASIATQFNLHIHGIEPALMTVFNRYQAEITTCDCLLIAEPHHLLLAMFEAGEWQNFAVATPPAGQAAQECVNMLARAMHLKSHPTGRLAYFGSDELIAHQPLQGLNVLSLAKNTYRHGASILINESRNG